MREHRSSKNTSKVRKSFRRIDFSTLREMTLRVKLNPLRNSFGLSATVSFAKAFFDDTLEHLDLCRTLRILGATLEGAVRNGRSHFLEQAFLQDV